MNPLISIIIPAYNVEPYIEKCIKSVLNQTYTNIEIIVVDDGSSDNTGAICDDIAKTDSRLIVFHQINHGVSSARNAGLEKAKGEYIAFIDSDDWIEQTLYEDAISAFSNDEIDCFMFEYSIDNENDSNVHRCADNCYGLLSSEDLLKYCIGPQNRFSVTKIFKRELLGDTRYDTNIILGEDTLFICSILEKSKGGFYSDKPYYHYEQREGSAVRSNFNKRKLTGITAYERVLENAKATGFDEYIKESRKALVNLSIQLAKRILQDSTYNDKKEDLKYIKSVVKKYSKGMNFNSVDKKTFVKILIAKYCINLLKFI